MGGALTQAAQTGWTGVLVWLCKRAKHPHSTPPPIKRALAARDSSSILMVSAACHSAFRWSGGEILARTCLPMIKPLHRGCSLRCWPLCSSRRGRPYQKRWRQGVSENAESDTMPTPPKKGNTEKWHKLAVTAVIQSGVSYVGFILGSHEDLKSQLQVNANKTLWQ